MDFNISDLVKPFIYQLLEKWDKSWNMLSKLFIACPLGLANIKGIFEIFKKQISCKKEKCVWVYSTSKEVLLEEEPSKYLSRKFGRSISDE